MPNKLRAAFPIILITLFSLFLFRDYFIKGLVPFPANLLVSYYEPWKSYPVPEYPNGPPNKAMGFDNLRIFYPVKKVAIEAIKMGQPPLWNPYNFAGNPVLGSYQSAVFHPLAWLFLIVPQIDAWSIMTILQPIFAALAMYIFLSTLHLHPVSRLIGALTFAFSGFFVVWWQESYMYTYSALFLPLALSAVEMYHKKPKTIWLVLLTGSLTLSIFSGMPQITFYVYAFVAIWVLYRRTYILQFFFGMLLSGILASVQLLPSIEAYTLSTRISTDVKYIFDAFLLPLPQLVTLIAPDYFGNPATYNYFGKGFYHDRLIYLGSVPLVLILTQLSKRTFFSVVFLVTLSLMFSLPTTWVLLYHLKLPFLSTMTPSRIMVLVTFAGAVLAAYGTQEYFKGFSKRTLVIMTIILILSLVLSAGIAFWFRWAISLRNLIIPSTTFTLTLVVLWIHARYRNIGYILLLVIMLANTFLFARKYLYFSERRFVYPPLAVFDELKKRALFDRFWTYENGYIEKNFASYYGLFSPEGYDAYMIRRYGEFLAFANSHGTSLEPDRSNALIQSTDHIDDIFTDPYRTKTLQLLGVRYIVRKLVPDKNEQKILPDPKGLSRMWEDGTYAIHEYAAALPRAVLFSDVRIVSDVLPALFDPRTDIQKTVFVEEPITLTPNAKGTANITSYKPNAVSISTTTDGDMILFLSDTYYPGWKAYVDNRQSKIYRANYAFRAVAVPTGNHTVEFRFEPQSWKLGVLGSVIGLLICIVVLIRGASGNRTRA